MARVATIGVYGCTLERFLDALDGADVRQLLDVRQRRGVRGSEYSWANSRRLQAALAGAGIEYRHHREFAPTTELAGSSTARTIAWASASVPACCWPASIASATCTRSSTAWTWLPSWRPCHAQDELLCSASSATPRRVTGR